MMAVVFDFDGVLVDSYSCLPSIYEKVARLIGYSGSIDLFVSAMLELEDVAEYMGIWDKKALWKAVLDVEPKILTEIDHLYWSMRTQESRPIYRDLWRLIEKLKEKHGDIDSYILCGCDTSSEAKHLRIIKSGISISMFRDVIIYGCESRYRSLKHGILELAARGYDTIVYIDDKTQNLNKLDGLAEEFKGRLILVNHVFNPPLPLKLSWIEKPRVNVVKVRDLYGILEIL